MHQRSPKYSQNSGLTKSNETIRRLSERAEAGLIFRIALIGAGVYGRTLACQLTRVPGLKLACICDRDLRRAYELRTEAGIGAADCLVTDAFVGVREAAPDLIVDCTGSPAAGARIARIACELPAHLIMVNAEADACIGPEIATRLESRGKIYSLAVGDQPSLAVGLADWAAEIGLSVVTAGKWTDAWKQETAAELEASWHDAGRTVSDTDRMFLDGTKANIELACIANCLGFVPDRPGMHGPSYALADIPEYLRTGVPSAILSRTGVVDYINCVGVPREQVHPGGVFVVVQSDNAAGMEVMARKGNIVSDDYTHMLLYRPFHLLGVETLRSITRALLFGQPTAAPKMRAVDVVAVTKKALAAGHVLAGPGHDVRGEIHAAPDVEAESFVPVGIAAGAVLRCDVEAGVRLRHDMVRLDADDPAVMLRTDAEARTI